MDLPLEVFYILQEYLLGSEEQYVNQAGENAWKRLLNTSRKLQLIKKQVVCYVLSPQYALRYLYESEHSYQQFASYFLTAIRDRITDARHQIVLKLSTVEVNPRFLHVHAKTINKTRELHLGSPCSLEALDLSVFAGNKFTSFSFQHHRYFGSSYPCQLKGSFSVFSHLHSFQMQHCQGLKSMDLSSLRNCTIVNLSDTDVSQVNCLAGGKIRTLVLSNCQQVADVSHLGGIPCLDISSTGVTDMAALNQVRQLNISATQNMKGLSPRNAIQKLTLKGYQLSILRALPNHGIPCIEIRDGYSYYVWDWEYDSIAACFTGVRELYHVEDRAAFLPLRDFKSIEKLHVLFCHGISLISDLPNLVELTIRVAHTKSNNTDIDCGTLPKLKKLTLSGFYYRSKISISSSVPCCSLQQVIMEGKCWVQDIELDTLHLPLLSLFIELDGATPKFLYLNGARIEKTEQYFP